MLAEETQIQKEVVEEGKKIIQVRGINKEFKVANETVHVIKDVSFEIQEGEFIIVSGPSGSGKSTLLNMIAGWEEPTSGSIVVDGNDLFAMGEDDRIDALEYVIGIVSQQPHWIKALNTIENVEIPYILLGHTRAESRERAEKLISFLGLKGIIKHRPVDLSGGQQQRINLLRALVRNPKVLIADEPTGALDSISTALLMDLLMELNSILKRTIIVATHDMELKDYATRVISIVDGQIDEDTQIKQDFKSEKPIGDVVNLQDWLTGGKPPV